MKNQKKKNVQKKEKRFHILSPFGLQEKIIWKDDCPEEHNNAMDDIPNLTVMIGLIMITFWI